VNSALGNCAPVRIATAYGSQWIDRSTPVISDPLIYCVECLLPVTLEEANWKRVRTWNGKLWKNPFHLSLF
jgi:hypothetical protein